MHNIGEDVFCCFPTSRKAQIKQLRQLMMIPLQQAVLRVTETKIIRNAEATQNGKQDGRKLKM